MKRLLVLAAAVAAAGGSGCANARYVHKAGDEGVVAVGTNTDTWPTYNRTNALKLIEAHVGQDYVIVGEREVPTGTATTNTQQTSREPAANPAPFLPAQRETTTATTTVKDVTEYQIVYRRKAAQPVAAAAGLPAGFVPAGSGVAQAQHTDGPPAAAPRSVAPAAMVSSPGLPPPDIAGFGTGR